MSSNQGLQPHRWREDARPLGALLGVDLLLGVLVAWKVPFQAPNPSYLCDAVQFAATHRVASVFLPVGYSGILGISDRLAGQAGMTALSILLSLAVIAAAWVFLRVLGASIRATLVLTAMLSVYPDLLLSYNKAQDTALTAVLLFGFVVLLLRTMAAKRFGAADVLLAVTLGYAVMVRPNLVLLLPLVWLVYWRFRMPRSRSRLAWQLVIAAVVYVAGTAAIHGRPFLPQNGPYNLYSGANEFTAAHIANEEDSLIPAMGAHGITVIDPDVLCIQDSADPSRPDMHERRLDPIYTRFALEYMREYPAGMLRLMGMKLVTLLSPDLWVYSPRSVGGMLKILSALAFPLWLVALLIWPQPGPQGTRFVLVGTVVAYILPFVLTISSARFRVPLDFLLWMDFGAIVVARYFTSMPRPAA